MNELEHLKQGWEFMASVIGSEYASSNFTENTIKNEIIREKNIYIEKINSAIDILGKNINEHPYSNIDVELFKGYVAEEWHAETFNIDALRKGSENRAWTLQDNHYGSVDIDTNFGKSYSLKYSNTAEVAENMQADVNRETNLPKYQGQERLIAGEQIEEAKKLAHRRALRNIESRPSVSHSHSDTEEHLVSKITDSYGVESKELSIKEAKQIASEAKRNSFDPEQHGYNKELLLDEIRINYVNQAIKAGLTAAAISTIIQIVPELYKAIDYLIKHGEIDLNNLKKSGKQFISSIGEAFLKGSTAYCVEIAIQKGLLGDPLKKISPSLVGVAVVVILGTIKDSILVAAGKMTPNEMGVKFIDTIVVSSGYLVSIKIGGSIVQALCPQLPIIGYAIGSLLGCSIAATYNIGKKKFISFCVDTGFTCFGLVDQSYKLPEDVLADMGVHTIPVPRTKISKSNICRINTSTTINQIKYETIDIVVLRRGIIGINKVGYVPK